MSCSICLESIVESNKYAAEDGKVIGTLAAAAIPGHKKPAQHKRRGWKRFLGLGSSHSSGNVNKSSDDYTVVATTCGHVFHLECLSSWFQRASECPTCRKRQEVTGLLKLHFDTDNTEPGHRNETTAGLVMSMTYARYQTLKTEQESKIAAEKKRVDELHKQETNMMRASYEKQMKNLKKEVSNLNTKLKNEEKKCKVRHTKWSVIDTRIGDIFKTIREIPEDESRIIVKDLKEALNNEDLRLTLANLTTPVINEKLSEPQLQDQQEHKESQGPTSNKDFPSQGTEVPLEMKKDDRRVDETSEGEITSSTATDDKASNPVVDIENIAISSLPEDKDRDACVPDTHSPNLFSNLAACFPQNSKVSSNPSSSCDPEPSTLTLAPLLSQTLEPSKTSSVDPPLVNPSLTSKPSSKQVSFIPLPTTSSAKSPPSSNCSATEISTSIPRKSCSNRSSQIKSTLQILQTHLLLASTSAALPSSSTATASTSNSRTVSHSKLPLKVLCTEVQPCPLLATKLAVP